LEQIPPNFPCIELVAYLGQIPLNLNLKNLGNDAMFKDVTLFIKLKAKEYAVKFFPLCNNHRSSNLQVLETSIPRTSMRMAIHFLSTIPRQISHLR
jgi:hypothetical protein